MRILLLLFLFILLALLWCHFSNFISFIVLFFAQFFDLLLLLLLISFLGLSRRCLFAIFLTFGPSRVGKLQAHHFIDDCEHGLEHFKCLGHGLFSVSDFESGSHENRVLVIDLLISDVKLIKAVSIFLQNFSNVGIDELVGNLLVLSKHDEVVFLCKFPSFFLVRRWLWYRKVFGTDGIEE